MKTTWEHIKDSPTRCVALCENDGNKIFDIFAKVWRLDTGEWAYACNSDLWKSGDIFYAGKEPSRDLAIKTIETGMERIGG